MKSLYVLMIRLVLSLLLAYFICRFFFPGRSIFGVLGLAVVMCALAYLFQYTRKRDKGEKDEN